MPTILTWKEDDGSTESVRFDIVSTETHDLLSAITEHPVEEGVNITDHVRPELDHLSIEGYVSNKPLFKNPGVEEFMDFDTLKLDLPERALRPTLQQGVELIGNAIGDLLTGGPPDKATVLTSGGDFRNRARDIFDKLKKARSKSRIIRIVTTMAEYESMVLERVSVPRSVQDGTGATFQVDLKQIRRVKAERVAAPVPAEARGMMKKALGSAHADKDEKDAKKAEHAKSIAAQLFDGARSSLADLVSPPGL